MKHNPDKDSVLADATAPHLELTGNTRCAVDGVKSISEYTADKIKMNLGKTAVSFYGDALCINSFSPEGAIVEGTILTVAFEDNA